jgi:hypothetical protein
MVVNVAVAHRASVKNQGMIEKVAIAIGCVLQTFQKVRHEADVIRVYLRESLQLRSTVLMMRCRMEPFGNSKHGICSITDFPRHHERRNPSDVGLKRQSHEIEHQLGVFLVIIGNTRWRCGNCQFRIGVLLFGELNAALNLTNGVQVLGDPIAVVRSRLP